MKVAIIGAGAMGCLYGAYISKRNEVVMIDSYRPQVEAINSKGIMIEELDGTRKQYNNIKAYLSGSYAEHVDLVIVFVKSTFTEAALEQNKNLFQPDTVVMTLQNGAGNDRKIEQYVKSENIVIGTSRQNALNLGQGCSKHTGVGVTTIGSNHNADKTLEQIQEVLEESGCEVVISEDIQRIIWSKLFVNLSVNTLTALTETPIGYVIQNEYAWEFAKRLIYEAVDVAEADGTYFDRREALNIVRDICKDSKDGYSSMYQDRKKHVKMEIDAINGAVVEQAKRYGVPTPYNTLIVDLIHAIEGAYEWEKQLIF
jgi:2-dehydropantoate 2-reductase